MDRPASHPTPDGTEPEAYRWLEQLDRSGWAWEWLRRDPGYRGKAVEQDAGVPGPRLLPADAADPQRGLLFRGGPFALGA